MYDAKADWQLSWSNFPGQCKHRCINENFENTFLEPHIWCSMEAQARSSIMALKCWTCHYILFVFSPKTGHIMARYDIMLEGGDERVRSYCMACISCKFRYLAGGWRLTGLPICNAAPFPILGALLLCYCQMHPGKPLMERHPISCWWRRFDNSAVRIRYAILTPDISTLASILPGLSHLLTVRRWF